MPTTFDGKLVVAIASRALFDLDASHRVYETEGIQAYQAHQIAREEEILPPGAAFVLVKKLLALNQVPADPVVEVVLLSRNSADTGLRVFKSIQHYNLAITRAVFTGGGSPYAYASALGAHLFLSSNPEDVANALAAGIAAATIVPVQKQQSFTDQLRIAFDGDAVLFSDEAERIYQQHDLSAFLTSETLAAKQPLEGGPFKPFLAALHKLQQAYPANASPIRTALVTARSAPAHERVIRTLRAWNIRIDEALFLGGLSKGEFLRAFGADIFFDDHPVHCASASEHVATGHVPHGIVNEN